MNFSLNSRILLVPIAIIVVILAGLVLRELQGALLGFVVAVFLSMIFFPIVEFFAAKKIPVVFAIIIVLICVAGAVYTITMILSVSISSMQAILPRYETRWQQDIFPSIMALLPEELQQKVREFKWDTTFTPSAVASALTGFGNTIATLVSDWGIILLFMIFILAGQGQFRRKIKIAFPPDSAEKIYVLFDAIYHQCRKYIIAVTLFNVLSGVTMTVVLMIFGVDLALFWGLLTFLLTFIPSVGSIFAAALPIVVSFLQFKGIGQPLLIGIVVISTQIFIGSYLAPRVMGNTLNISPLLIIVSLIFWGWVWGPWGMVLSVPITSMIAIIFENVEPLKPIAVLMRSEPHRRITRLRTKKFA